MDKLKVLQYLIADFEEQGVVLAKSAKEISDGTGLPLCETYKTLDALRSDSFIWRVGRRKLYRYGLKQSEDLDYLCELFRSLARNQPLPRRLRISYESLDEVQRKLELERKEEEEWRVIKLLQKQLAFTPSNKRLEAFERVASEMATEFVNSDQDQEAFKQFLEKKITSIWEEIIGARLIGEVE